MKIFSHLASASQESDRWSKEQNVICQTFVQLAAILGYLLLQCSAEDKIMKMKILVFDAK